MIGWRRIVSNEVNIMASIARKEVVIEFVLKCPMR